MYTVKKAGGGQATPYASWMRDDVQRRVSELSNAREALARNAIIPFYQPKISLRDGRIVGFEALLRWTDPSGVRSPGAINEAFDDPDLAVKLGRRMLDRVVSDMAAWQVASVQFGHVALNLAAHEFQDPGLAARILSTLSAARLEPGQLEIEVTEGVFMEDASEVVGTTLRSLDEAGIAISLDDFGTGYASLTHLKKYPVSWLKIDRSFVSNVETNPDSAAIVKAVVGLAQSIGIKVVAEGVETERQWRFLKERNCEVAQGFWLAKPMIGSRVPHFITNWAPLRIGVLASPAAIGAA
jgi:EAL domain-containing protein (putative c-di-GMP-specific phosphodiesterase class I)